MLGAGGLVLLTGPVACSARDETRADGASPLADPSTDDPDVALLTAAIQQEKTLLALAVATLRRHGDQARVVQPVVSRQRAHVTRLTASLTEPPALRRGPPPVVLRRAPAALKILRDQVSTAEQHRLSDCLDATSGLLARLLASVSASHATTVEALRSRP